MTPKFYSALFFSSFRKPHVTFITLTLIDPKMNLDLELLKRNVLSVSFGFFEENVPSVFTQISKDY